jgi:hypothetical protein
MIELQGLLPDLQGPLVERRGLGVAVLSSMDVRQIGEAGGDLRVIRAQGLLPDGERPGMQLSCVVVAALGAL